MELIALVLGAVLAIACVVFAARPFLRADTRGDELVPPRTVAEDERVRLVEERDRALAALKELEFDHRTGKVSDADYAELRRSLRRDAAEAIRGLEAAPASLPAGRSHGADVHA